AKTRARRRRRMTRATEKSLADLRVLLRRQTRPLVMNRKHDIQYFQRTAVRRGRAFGWCPTDPVHDRWCGLHSANGDEVVLAQLKELSHVGEQSLLPGRSGRRNASLRACEDTTLLRIPKAEFQKVLTQRHTLKDLLSQTGQQQVRANMIRTARLARMWALFMFINGFI